MSRLAANENIICENCQARNLSNAKYCMKCGNELPIVAIKPKPVAMNDAKPVKNHKSTIFTVILAVVAFIVSYFVIQAVFFNNSVFDKSMMEMASELNKVCPIMVDAETRLDNSIALPGNMFQYNYTLVNIEKSTIDTNEFKKFLEPELINQVKTNPQMEIFRKNKVTLNYNYRDKNGVFFLLISVTPNDYE